MPLILTRTDRIEDASDDDSQPTLDSKHPGNVLAGSFGGCIDIDRNARCVLTNRKRLDRTVGTSSRSQDDQRCRRGRVDHGLDQTGNPFDIVVNKTIDRVIAQGTCQMDDNGRLKLANDDRQRGPVANVNGSIVVAGIQGGADQRSRSGARNRSGPQCTKCKREDDASDRPTPRMWMRLLSCNRRRIK